MELMKVDILEGSVHTPMYNPHIIPLNLDKKAPNNTKNKPMTARNSIISIFIVCIQPNPDGLV